MKSERNFIHFIVSGIILFSTVYSLARDWPQWRGPNRNGISNELNLLKKWPGQGPELLWQVKDLGRGYSTPSVSGQQIFVQTNQGMEDEFVKSLGTESGKLLWTTRIGKVGLPDQQPNFPAARSTPTVDGDRVYALGSDGDLVCLDSKTGDIVWQKNLPADFNGKPGKWAYAESPLIDGEKIVCVPGGAEATMVALNKNDGTLIWKSAVPGGSDAGYSSIVNADIAGVKQYITYMGAGLVGINAETGALLWLYDKIKDNAPIVTPAVQDNYVYSGARAGCALVRIESQKDSVKAVQVYLQKDLPNAIGGFVLIDGYLYGASGKSLLCVEFKTGQIKWQEPSIAPGSLCYAEGRLYLHGENGNMALIEATPEKYCELGRFTPPDLPEHKNNREMAWAYPVIADGRLYFRDQDAMWCYKIKAD